MIKQAVNKLMETELERKDFLKLVGLGAIAVTGITAILGNLQKSTTGGQAQTKSASLSYGSSVYGGVKK